MSVWGSSFLAHSDDVVALAFSPDGQWVAAAAGMGDIRLWDLEARRELWIEPGTQYMVGVLAFSADGSRLLVSTSQGSGISEPRSGESIATFPGRPYFDAAAFLPGGDIIVVGDRGRIVEHDGRTLEPVRERLVLPEEPSAPQLSRDGGRLLYLRQGRDVAELVLRDLAAGLPERLLGSQPGLVSLALGPRGGTALSGDRHGEVLAWSLGEPVARRVLRPAGGTPAGAVAVSSDGRRAAIGIGRRIELWDLASGTPIEPGPVTGHRGEVRAIAVSGDGSQVMTGDTDGKAILWDLDGTPRSTWQLDHPVDRIVLGRGHALAGGTAWIEPPPRGSLVQLPDPKASLEVLGLEDGSSTRILVEDAALRELAELPGAAAARVALLRHGTLDVLTVDLEPGSTPAHLLLGHPGSSSIDLAVAIAPDGRRALVGDCQDGLELWDLERGALVWRRLLPSSSEGAPSAFHCVAGLSISPDGSAAIASQSYGQTLLVSGSAGGTLREMGGGEELVATAFSPDGLLAAGVSWGEGRWSMERTVILWDVATGERLDTIDFGDCGDQPTAAAFLPGGKGLIVGLERGPVLRFEIR